MSFAKQGWLNIPSGIDLHPLQKLQTGIFQSGRAGTRNLLDHPLVHEVAIYVGEYLSRHDLLDAKPSAIQAIAFDKSTDTNWKVSWHQDLMFPFARMVSASGYDLACEKDGIPFARPPTSVLENLTAVRLSLDPCGHDNGPLRVSPGTHREGIIPTGKIMERIGKQGEVTCTNAIGDLLILKPLLLHASSQALTPNHRRILHFVYHSGTQVAEAWHRAV
jgi:ectoine hydroxylase-related dioxygenase (phytanoyl-CoA dioxygenase family)